MLLSILTMEALPNEGSIGEPLANGLKTRQPVLFCLNGATYHL